MSTEIESLSTDKNAQRAGRGMSPMLVVFVVAALLLAVYAHWRFGQFDDRLDRLRQQAGEQRDANERLMAQLTEMSGRVAQSDARVREEIRKLNEIPPQVSELGQSVAELRARTEAPQRTWVRAEALYLLELADRRLRLEHDVPTALAAMESADARLVTVTDPAVAEVRQQLQREIAALREVPVPDLPQVVTRISRLEVQAAEWPVLGLPVAAARRPPASEAVEQQGPVARAIHRLAQALRDLVSLRSVDPRAVRMVTREEEALRREHLDLLLFAARVAAMQQDKAAYSQSLAAADAWISRVFDGASPAVTAGRAEIAALAAIDIDPPRPEVGAAAQLLQRVIRGAQPRP